MKQAEQIIAGWYGGDYEDAGLFNSKKDAQRGYLPDTKLYEIFNTYDGKKIKITIEIIEE